METVDFTGDEMYVVSTLGIGQTACGGEEGSAWEYTGTSRLISWFEYFSNRASTNQESHCQPDG